MKEKRRPPGPLWNESAGRNKRRTLPTRSVKCRSCIDLNGAVSCIVWREKGPGTLQYACALQYVSYCNNERYKDQVAPTVKTFWDEVAEPFGSRALQNLDLSHVVGRAMIPNHTAKIPDYGVRDHIALVCGPFFASVESRSQYEARRCRREEARGHAGASSSHCSPSHGPERSREWDREPPTPKASRARSKHHSCSRKRALSRTPQGGSPRDSSSSRGWKLPAPP